VIIESYNKVHHLLLQLNEQAYLILVKLLKEHLHHVSVQVYHLQGEQYASFNLYKLAFFSP